MICHWKAGIFFSLYVFNMVKSPFILELRFYKTEQKCMKIRQTAEKVKAEAQQILWHFGQSQQAHGLQPMWILLRVDSPNEWTWPSGPLISMSLCQIGKNSDSQKNHHTNIENSGQSIVNFGNMCICIHTYKNTHIHNHFQFLYKWLLLKLIIILNLSNWFSGA